MIHLKQTFRWFGPQDPVTLSDIKMTGATGIVTALHHIPNGVIWSVSDIKKRKNLIEKFGLKWEVVESVPIHEDIKTQTGSFKKYIENYKKTLSNLSKCNINVVCYNFMPVLDWTRTNLNYCLNDGSTALRFDRIDLMVFELFLLKRPEAEKLYSKNEIALAKARELKMTSIQKKELNNTIIAGLPGAEEGYTLYQFNDILKTYKNIDTEILRNHLILFLNEIISTAERCNILMCIHPDDPPYPIFGLPRVVSTLKDIEYIFNAVSSIHNGLTFCTGSFGVRLDNDIPFMIEKLGERIHFFHLRNIIREENGSFFEANHLEGDIDMVAVMNEIIKLQNKRKEAGRLDFNIPMRPDHGHKMLDDLKKVTNPGYSCIGRLRGLSELRGLELGLRLGKNL
jgi:mannonate dehydratase